MIVSGLVTSDNGTTYIHGLLSTPIASPCSSAFKMIGSFADAQYFPMAHGSEFDSAGQKLYISIATAAHAFGLGVVDVTAGKLVKVVPYGGSGSGGNTHYLWGSVIEI